MIILSAVMVVNNKRTGRHPAPVWLENNLLDNNLLKQDAHSNKERKRQIMYFHVTTAANETEEYHVGDAVKHTNLCSVKPT